MANNPLYPAMKERITETDIQCVVSVDSAQEWVTITSKTNPEEQVFLQGSHATNFITLALSMYKEWDITKPDAYLYLAYDYLILLGEC